MIKDFISRYEALFLALVVFFTDRIVKVIVAQNILFNEKINILSGVISFTKTFNTGAAFGILKDYGIFLTIFSVLVIIGIIVYLVKGQKSIDSTSSIAWGLILGGTAGNLYDRLIHHHVIDFIRIDFINFPVFNIADMSINAGSIILIVYLLFFADKYKQKKELKSGLSE